MVWGLLIQVAGLNIVGFSIFVFPIPRPLPVNQPQILSKILCQVCVWDFATESSSPSLMPFNKSEWWWVGGVGVGMGMGMGDGDGWVGGWGITLMPVWIFYNFPMAVPWFGGCSFKWQD